MCFVLFGMCESLPGGMSLSMLNFSVISLPEGLSNKEDAWIGSLRSLGDSLSCVFLFCWLGVV